MKDIRTLLYEEGHGRSGTGLGLAVVWGTVKDHEDISMWRVRWGRGNLHRLSACDQKGKRRGRRPTPIEDLRGKGSPFWWWMMWKNRGELPAAS